MRTIGVSACHMERGKAAPIAPRVQCTAVCVVPRWRTSSSWKSLSSNSRSSKVREKVRSGVSATRRTKCGHDRGVEAPAQVRPDRHIRAKLQSYAVD